MPFQPTGPVSAAARRRIRKKQKAGARFRSEREAAHRRQIEEINRHLDEIGDRVFGPTHSGRYTPKKAAERGRRLREAPASETRTAAARDWMERADRIAARESALDPFLNVAKAYGILAEKGLDFATGIPTLIRDPSLANAGWAAASVFPFGKAARVARAGATTVGRTIGSDIFQAAIRPAGSRTGRTVEQAASTVAGRLAPSHAARQAAWETGRTLATRSEVVTAAGKALSRLSRRLTAAEHNALLVAAEGKTVSERVAAHRRWIDELAPVAQDASLPAKERAVARASISFHNAHIKSLEQASRYIDNTPAGPAIAARAPERLREAWRLLEASQGAREQVLRDLGVLTDDAIRRRRHIPGRVIGGARWTVDEATGAGAVVGDETFEGGQQYVRSARGVPGVNYGTATAPVRLTVAWMSGGPRRVMSGLRRDPSLQKEMTGELIRSGFFRTDVGNLSAEQLMRAWRLMKTREARDVFLSVGVDIDTALKAAAAKGEDLTSMFIPVRDTSEVLFRGQRSPISPLAHDLLEGVQIGKKQVAQADDKGLDAMLRELFPDADAAARGLLDVPVKWVPKEVVWGLSDDMTRWHLTSAAKYPAVKGISQAWAAVNDMMRFGILYAPPTTLAYITANLLGNAALMVVDQGPFLLRSIMDAFPGRKASLFGKLRPEHQVALDLSAGAGATLAIGTFGNNAIRKGLGGYTSLVHAATDLVPRRAAMLYHLRKAGYDTSAKIGALLDAVAAGDDGALRAYDNVKRAANDAMIDFDRLGALEKSVVSQTLFLYPWLKGATRYTARFPVEHPLLGAAAGYGIYKQQELRDEQLGPGPWYETPLVKLPQALVDWIPWADPAKEYVFNVGSIVPFYQPVELAQSIVGTVTGDASLPSVFGTLSPSIQNLVSFVTGYDPEMHREIEGNVLERAASVIGDDIRPVRMAQQLLEPEEEREQNLYPRSNADIVAGAVLGSVAPKPRNPETAAEIVQEPQEKRAGDRQQLVAAARAAGAPADVVREYGRLLVRRQQLDDQIEDGATPEQKARKAFAMARRVLPDARAEIDEAVRQLELAASDEAWQAAYERARAILFADYISRVESAVREQERGTS